MPGRSDILLIHNKVGLQSQLERTVLSILQNSEIFMHLRAGTRQIKCSVILALRRPQILKAESGCLKF